MRVFQDMTPCTLVDELGTIVLEEHAAFMYPEDEGCRPLSDLGTYQPDSMKLHPG
jgi:hypothetical protein